MSRHGSNNNNNNNYTELVFADLSQRFLNGTTGLEVVPMFHVNTRGLELPVPYVLSCDGII